MTFVKVNPRRKRRRHSLAPVFHNILNEIMNSSIPEIVRHEPGQTRPMVNVVENNDAFRLDMAIPGIAKEDMTINVEKDLLTVSANKESERKEGEKVKRNEFDFNKFSRDFRLPETIDASNISAAFNNGILSLTLPKKEEAKDQPARKVEIK